MFFGVNVWSAHSTCNNLGREGYFLASVILACISSDLFRVLYPIVASTISAVHARK